MYLFHVFRSFLPLRNPVGFGASDFIEFFIALALVVFVLARPRVESAARRLAQKTGWAMAFLFALAIVLRLALLPFHPVPVPAAADDFSYLLLGDTLAHFRLANPPHPMSRFFETTYVLQHPAYGSIYPPGPALALALGQLVFGLPWAGVLLGVAAFCALCYWALRGWTTPGWALVGGLLAICEFGPLNQWVNSYWGGGVAALSGCLAIGALPRLRKSGRTRDAILLGAGLGLQFLTRPFESVFLTLAAVLFLMPGLRDPAQRPKLLRASITVTLAALPALGLVLLHNRASTGSWTTLPYMLSRYQYGVPTTFTFQPVPVLHASLTPVQRLYYEGQSALHGEGPETFGAWFARLLSRTGFYRFFLLAPLYCALPLFLLCLREFRFAWVAVTILLFAFGSSFYPYFYPHYLGAIACLFVLAAVVALDRLSRVKFRGYAAGLGAARWILYLCGVHFLFWYGLYAMGDVQMLHAMTPYAASDFINTGDPEKRIAIEQRLAEAPGRQLVFIRYYPSHGYHEWLHNAADIDRARVVWALDLGAAGNEQLRRYYPGRTAWLLEPDALPPRLRPYPSNPSPFEPVE